jgi:hypothetical protein
MQKMKRSYRMKKVVSLILRVGTILILFSLIACPNTIAEKPALGTLNIVINEDVSSRS